VYQYLQKHGLKYHPLWDQGYLSVGDTHTTRKWEPGMANEHAASPACSLAHLSLRRRY
jgi:3'-phosphoadenosine 5'-phosphosulfate sulfotransferase (PAPS reductase)/FAD synthetase